MNVVVLHGVAHLFREQIVIDERLGRFRGKLHHHTRRRVGIHVGVFARHVVAFDVHNVQKHIACLGLAGDGALVAILNVLLGDVFARTFHQFHLHGILYVLYRHLRLAPESDVVCYLHYQCLIFSLVGVEHGLADGSHNLLLVEAGDAAIALNYCLNHILSECFYCYTKFRMQRYEFKSKVIRFGQLFTC